jgi:hypothetical protein
MAVLNIYHLYLVRMNTNSNGVAQRAKRAPVTSTDERRPALG